ncbi:MAG: hypothetical protein IRZ15_06190 [Bryobacteraceae bacterium]|nr:hypothetical protein [Bryobacteraceae bacterium]
MKSLAIGLFVFATLLVSAQEKRKQSKPPDVTLLEVSGRRMGSTIALDGRLKNSGMRTIERLTLLFDFLGPNGQVLTTKKGVIDKEVLEPQEESSFSLETDAPPRAVAFRVKAEDSAERELRLEPFESHTID